MELYVNWPDCEKLQIQDAAIDYAESNDRALRDRIYIDASCIGRETFRQVGIIR